MILIFKILGLLGFTTLGFLFPYYLVIRIQVNKDVFEDLKDLAYLSSCCFFLIFIYVIFG